MEACLSLDGEHTKGSSDYSPPTCSRAHDFPWRWLRHGICQSLSQAFITRVCGSDNVPRHTKALRPAPTHLQQGHTTSIERPCNKTRKAQRWRVKLSLRWHSNHCISVVMQFKVIQSRSATYTYLHYAFVRKCFTKLPTNNNKSEN